MLLKNLINSTLKNNNKLNIKGLSINSKSIKKNYIFFAIKGNKKNGENYIQEAIKKGAAVIICSKNCKFKSNKVIVIKTNRVRNFLSNISSKFYRLKPKNIIAVTGTNGKTSVADFFYQILKINKISVASVGTLGIKYNGKNIKTNLTSPDTITIHRALEKIKKNKIDNLIIEASSHGLDQNRLDNINFKAGIFTNFSQDHLDYHKSMKTYLNAKLILFSKLIPQKKYMITDKYIKQFSILKKIAKRRKLKLLDITKQKNALKNLPDSISNSFQKKNLSMAILAARLCGLNNIKINKALKKIKNVTGRLELVKKYSNNIRVFIDYAHTPDALHEVLKSLRGTYENNISLVFGCGGERDIKKRPLMANIAKSFCKKIYVTDDNPRKENPAKIRGDIIKNLRECTYYNIGDRSQAIKKALSNAEMNEIILIAGKGHENYQDYGKKIISISDKEIVKKLNLKMNKIINKNQNFDFNKKILNQILKKKIFFKFDGLSIDSRDIKKNNLFLTLKGKKNNGKDFIAKALKKGASYIVSSKVNSKYKKKMIKVNNEITFLNQFARLKRKNSDATIIAITGSAGKTSLKNLLKILLQQFGNTYASPKSFNNHLGVPISLSNLNSDHKFGVFEIGMSKAGEINNLTKMVRPNIGVITNIGEAHIENFNNIKGIANAKSEIIDNIEEHGTIILNRDDKFFKYLNKKAIKRNLNITTFGTTIKADVHLIKIKKFKNYKQISVNVKNMIIKLNVKNININNMLCSIAVLSELNQNLTKINHVFKNYELSDGRGKIHKIKRYKKHFNLIDESYNANPLSVKNAINNFAAIKKKEFKKYLLLGDMLELGKKSEILHKKLSRLINSSDIDKVFIKGEKTLFTYKNLKKQKRGNIFQCDQDIDHTLKNIISNNDYLMIKGSNATGLNNISNTMIKGS